jgi:hypothetical protein
MPRSSARCSSPCLRPCSRGRNPISMGCHSNDRKCFGINADGIFGSHSLFQTPKCR